jgi:mannosyltransferase
MALAKPVRGLLLVAVVLWCIFLWQMFFSSAPSISGPEGKNVNFDRDPNLDRTQLPKISSTHGLGERLTRA